METAGETCVPSNPIPNGLVWGTTDHPFTFKLRSSRLFCFEERNERGREKELILGYGARRWRLIRIFRG